MVLDVLVVFDVLYVDCVCFVGWSDGVCIVFVLVVCVLECVVGVFFFVCNMDLGGMKEMVLSLLIDYCFVWYCKDYV